jgi:hypothetical protein
MTTTTESTTPKFTADNWSDLSAAEKFLDIVDRSKVIKYLAIAAAEATGADRDNFLLGIKVLSDDIWFAAENASEELIDRIRDDIGDPDWRRAA